MAEGRSGTFCCVLLSCFAADAGWPFRTQDSNAAVYLNGQPIMRKMTRFGHYDIRSTVFNGTRGWTVADSQSFPLCFATVFVVIFLSDTVFLNAIQWNTTNVLVVHHFNWGNIVTFQRTGQVQAGFWLDSNIGASTENASSWMWLLDPAQLRHNKQVLCSETGRRQRLWLLPRCVWLRLLVLRAVQHGFGSRK
jgi:hypothetical protein